MLQPKKISVVQETEWGTYFWQLPSGQYLGDGDGRFLTLMGKAHDIKKMQAMRDEAAALGYPDGEVKWEAGVWQATDSEHDDQMERLLDGKIPNPYGMDMIQEKQKRGQM